MKKFALYTAGAVLMLAAAACDRDLDLAHAYDNSSSSKPYEFDKDFNFDDYIDFGSFVVSDRVVCEQQPDIPRYSFWLDGKISVGKYDDSGRFTLYWSADNSLRQTSDSPWLEENVNALSAEMEVFGKDLEPSTASTTAVPGSSAFTNSRTAVWPDSSTPKATGPGPTPPTSPSVSPTPGTTA